MTAAASAPGFTWQAFRAAAPEDYDRIFAGLAAEGFDAAYLPPSPLSYANFVRIAELGRRHRVVTLGDHPIFAKNGFLLTYGEDPNPHCGARGRIRRQAISRLKTGRSAD